MFGFWHVHHVLFCHLHSPYIILFASLQLCMWAQYRGVYSPAQLLHTCSGYRLYLHDLSMCQTDQQVLLLVPPLLTNKNCSAIRKQHQLSKAFSSRLLQWESTADRHSFVSLQLEFCFYSNALQLFNHILLRTFDTSWFRQTRKQAASTHRATVNCNMGDFTVGAWLCFLASSYGWCFSFFH